MYRIVRNNFFGIIIMSRFVVVNNEKRINMRKIEFKTSKEELCMSQPNENEPILSFVSRMHDEGWQYISNVDNTTEQQASEVVDESIHTGLFAHYVKDIQVNTYCYKSALYSLNSLLESLGVNDEWNKSTTYLFKRA